MGVGEEEEKSWKRIIKIDRTGDLGCLTISEPDSNTEQLKWRIRDASNLQPLVGHQWNLHLVQPRGKEKGESPAFDSVEEESPTAAEESGGPPSSFLGSRELNQLPDSIL